MAGEAKIFECPNCGAGVTLRAEGKSLSVACGSCGSIIDASNPNYQILSKYQVNARISPAIPLGTRAPFHGDPWEVIGFVVRVTGGIYSWREYLLYNPFKGFRWLTEYDGHWTFVTMIKGPPKPSSAGFMDYLGKRYKLFQSGEATVSYVIGEFYWRVKVGEKVGYSDYVAPPWILSVEGGKDERVWSIGEYVEPETVASAFKVHAMMPHRMGTGACQPFPYQEALSHLWTVGMGFVVLLLLLHLFSSHGILWNFITCSLLVLGPPILLQLHRGSFEQQRWGGSDVSSIGSLFGGDD